MLLSHGVNHLNRSKIQTLCRSKFCGTELKYWTFSCERSVPSKISPMPCERSLRLVRKVLISYPDLTLSKGDLGTKLGKCILNGRIVKTKPSRNRLQYYFKSLRSLPSFPSLDFFPAIVAVIWTPGLVMKKGGSSQERVGGGTSDAGRLRLEGVLFSRLQVRGFIGSCLDIFKRVRILDVQVYENVGKSLIEIFLKGPLTKILRIIFSRRTFIIRIY